MDTKLYHLNTKHIHTMGMILKGQRKMGKKFICQYINTQHQSNPLKYQRMEVTMPTCLG